jgi:uncharacterized protein (TIGR03118 family)
VKESYRISADYEGELGTMVPLQLRTALAVLTLLVIAPSAGRAADVMVQQLNLVSDGLVPAANIDPSLVNPFGITSSPTSVFWVVNERTGVVTLYDGAGTPVPQVVRIPPAKGSPAGSPGEPTGVVFNNTASDFQLGPDSQAFFLFATADGMIAGWNSGLGVVTVVTTPGADYLGLTLANNGAQNLLYAANFFGPRIDVFDGSFARVDLGPNAFVTPNPAQPGSHPWNVMNLNGTIYVTYEWSVSAFDPNGNFLYAVGADAPAGTHSVPWGMAIAPSSFGPFANAVLIGNFLNGKINAFDPNNGHYLGRIMRPDGTPFSAESLWGLVPGNGKNGGDAGTLYFVAGIGGELHGLLGSLTPTGASTSLNDARRGSGDRTGADVWGWLGRPADAGRGRPAAAGAARSQLVLMNTLQRRGWSNRHQTNN